MKPNQESKVEFTQRQLDFLRKNFPPIIGSPETTHGEFLHRSGQQTVVAFCAHHTQKERP